MDEDHTVILLIYLAVVAVGVVLVGLTYP